MEAFDEIKVKTLPGNILNIYNKKVVSAEEAVKQIKSGDNVVIQPGCAAPMQLIQAMVDRKDELEKVNIYHMPNPEWKSTFSIKHSLSVRIQGRLLTKEEQSSSLYSCQRFLSYLRMG